MNTTNEYGNDSIEGMNLNHFAYGDYSLASGNVRVYFRQLKARLIEHINRADMIIGSVAWLTDLDILQALAAKPSLITVQKEDFLRPDMVSRLGPEEKEALHNAYENLGKFDGSKVAVGPFFQCVQPQYRSLDPVVCFGLYKEGEMYKTPRLHHKFLVFLTEKGGFYYPTSVWTGSMNLTRLSESSLENAVVICDEKIATAYALEAQHIYLLGEPLDWTSEWINPFQDKQPLPAVMPVKPRDTSSSLDKTFQRLGEKVSEYTSHLETQDKEDVSESWTQPVPQTRPVRPLQSKSSRYSAMSADHLDKNWGYDISRAGQEGYCYIGT